MDPERNAVTVERLYDEVMNGHSLTAGTVVADGPFITFSNLELDDVNNIWTPRTTDHC